MTFYSGPNRLVCSVLEEMRIHLETLCPETVDRFKAFHKMYIEEAQTLVNRMESALEDWSDIRRARDTIKSLKKEIKALEKKRGDKE